MVATAAALPRHTTASDRALHFIRWAADTYGQPTLDDPDRVVIWTTQAQLTAACPGIRSAGTVAYYVSRLRDLGIVVGTRPIIVDLARLASPPAVDPVPRPSLRAVAPSPTTQPSRIEGGGGEDLPDLASRLAEVLQDCLAMQRQLMAWLANLLPSSLRPFAEIRDPDSRDSRKSAKFAENRESFQEGRKGPEVPKEQDIPPTEKNLLPSSPSPHATVRDSATTIRERSASRTVRGTGPQLTDEQIAEAVEPLRAWCRRHGRPARLDDRGRSLLATYREEQLRAGVATILAEANTAGSTISSPLGLLVARAASGDECFTPAPPRPVTNLPTPAEPEPPSADDQAVTEIESNPSRADELAALDDEVARLLDEEGVPQMIRERVARGGPVAHTHRVKAYARLRARLRARSAVRR